MDMEIEMEKQIETRLTPSLALATLTSPTKRKATTFEHDDTENRDPILFFSPKKVKSTTTTSSAAHPVKPVNYFLQSKPSTPTVHDFSKPTTTQSARPILTPRLHTPRITTTSIAKPSSLTAPAGRSPTRKRIGILNRRRSAGTPFTRISPPHFAAPSSSLNFSIDAALSGTIPSYKPPTATPAPTTALLSDASLYLPPLHRDAPKPSWDFEIYEDSESELATNLLEHGACTLDISSDEESVRGSRSERGKENVAPADDVSQTPARLGGRRMEEKKKEDVGCRW